MWKNAVAGWKDGNGQKDDDAFSPYPSIYEKLNHKLFPLSYGIYRIICVPCRKNGKF